MPQLGVYATNFCGVSPQFQYLWYIFLMLRFYRWQKITLILLAGLTFISGTYNAFVAVGFRPEMSFFIGLLLDLIIGIGANVLVVGVLFLSGNYIYRKFGKKGV